MDTTEVIPQAAPHLRIAHFAAEVREKLGAVAASAHYILGPEVASFEASFASYCGTAHCAGVASGTDALAIALRAVGVRPGDEVVTVSMTASATAMAILQIGARPVFVDVDRRTRCMDVSLVDSVISERTSAIVPVHLHGYPVDMPSLMHVASRRGLAVVEDCAQAHGASIGDRRVGSFGHAGAFSFYPTKNLGGIGDGGAIVTSDPETARKVRALRQYGWADERRISAEAGYNSRLDEIQAGVLNVLLPHLDRENADRREIAARYREGFAALEAENIVSLASESTGCVNHQFAIEVDHRAGVQQWLRSRRRVLTAVHYAVPAHRQPAFEDGCRTPLPVTDRLAERFLSLPIQSEAVAGREHEVIEGVIEAVRSCARS